MNFDFLGSVPKLNRLYQLCREAENLVLVSPTASVVASRKVLEYVVKLLYTHYVGDPGRQDIFTMITDTRFVQRIGDESLITIMHTIRKRGNVAAHDGIASPRIAVETLELTHFLVGDVCMGLKLINDYPEFVDPTAAACAIATPAQPPVAPAAACESVESPRSPASAAPVVDSKPVTVEPEVLAYLAPRMSMAKFDVSAGHDETLNKRLYVEASLSEAGWPIAKSSNVAVRAAAGIQCVLDNGEQIDYVLYGRDNRPLALVDFSTMVASGPVAARKKVVAAADALAPKLGYKPICYYTNGYQIFCIDQLGYPPRRVFTFHTIDELEYLKQRAGQRQDIANPVIRDEVTNRPYQKQAVTNVCRAFMDNRRRTLIVMATGTGKTRVSISLVEVLLKAGWIKNVLFLADRTSLARQAHKNFNKLLPEVTTSIYTGGETDRDSKARIIFSTYQTMIGLISDDTREFGIGRFDLIVVDEAHRSLFKKYSGLFNYFDALMVGLTATPRCEESKNTYEVFQLPNGQPDFAYELEEAINDGHLVGFQVLDRTTELIRRGIRYDDLAPEEKEQFEQVFFIDEGIEVPGDLTGTKVEGSQAAQVINTGTIDAMLGDLMQNGLKIDAGDKLGKTIIFAKSHIEAEVIVKRFQAIYGYMGMDFCKLIDSQTAGSQALIDSLGERDSMPQVAVSVDMLDTGIDVPDVLNLVFFKQVKSKIKFLQMVGRGTRLSKDIFGPGEDKRGFLVFDYFDNFRYFSTGNTWSTVQDGVEEKKGTRAASTSQTFTLNRLKLLLLSQLQADSGLNEFETAYRDELRAFFVSEVQLLNNDDIQVQYNMAYVNMYRVAERWDSIDRDAFADIEKHILPLLPNRGDHVKVKTFDICMYLVEDECRKRLLQGGKDPAKIRHGFQNVFNEIALRMDALLKLKSIPQVVAKEGLIEKMRDCAFLIDDFSLERCEYVRKELRDLMAFIPDERRYYIVDFVDKISVDETEPGPGPVKPYPVRALDYINTAGDPALAKLRNLDMLDQAERDDLEKTFKTKLGSDADFAAWSGGMPLLPWLRKQVGIADEALQTKFGAFYTPDVMNVQQLEYLNQIVLYARANGDVTFTDLQTKSPFCDVDVFALFGPEKSLYLKQFVNGIHKPVM